MNIDNKIKDFDDYSPLTDKKVPASALFPHLKVITAKLNEIDKFRASKPVLTCEQQLQLNKVETRLRRYKERYYNILTAKFRSIEIMLWISSIATTVIVSLVVVAKYYLG